MGIKPCFKKIYLGIKIGLIKKMLKKCVLKKLIIIYHNLSFFYGVN